MTLVLYTGLQSSLGFFQGGGVPLDDILHRNLVYDLGISPLCHVGFQALAKTLNLEVHDRTDPTEKLPKGKKTVGIASHLEVLGLRRKV